MDAQLERARQACERRAWKAAYAALSELDATVGLGADDLERLALSAYMLGDEPGYLAALERAHRAHLAAGAVERAVRCAFWLGLICSARGEAAAASGWLARGQRLLEGRDCVERGYLRLLATLHEPDPALGEAGAADAVEIGRRFRDRDLVSLAVHEQGHCLVRQRRVAEGLALMDESMVAVVAGELSPIVTGLVYCSVIDGCQRLMELRRAQEWTAALTRWCRQQPDLVTFTGRCLVHRAEILQARGAWIEALAEARQAAARMADARAVGLAFYRQGELHRLRGEPAAAEEAYREASRYGLEPQPGLALLRLAQGNVDAAVAAIRRVADETNDPVRRAALLPAFVEIMLAAADLDAARTARQELEALADGRDSAVLSATAAQASGALHLANGNPRAALGCLRAAADAWRDLGAPYEAARVRELVGLACRALGDEDSATMELDAAHDAFERLGAATDLARLDRRGGAHGLSPRELQVLRLVAAGETNREIAAELVLSERTVERHVSNIFAKLGVSTRAAATAYAYEHRLVSGITH